MGGGDVTDFPPRHSQIDFPETGPSSGNPEVVIPWRGIFGVGRGLCGESVFEETETADAGYAVG